MTGTDAGPPLLPFIISVGVTGHRLEALAGRDQDRLADRICATLEQVAQVGAALQSDQPGPFGSAAPQMRLVSPLADGADQIAAECAVGLGWELQVILPL